MKNLIFFIFMAFFFCTNSDNDVLDLEVYPNVDFSKVGVKLYWQDKSKDSLRILFPNMIRREITATIFDENLEEIEVLLDHETCFAGTYQLTWGVISNDYILVFQLHYHKKETFEERVIEYWFYNN